jgi:hypothetical protein
LGITLDAGELTRRLAGLQPTNVLEVAKAKFEAGASVRFEQIAAIKD